MRNLQSQSITRKKIQMLRRVKKKNSVKFGYRYSEVLIVVACSSPIKESLIPKTAILDFVVNSPYAELHTN